MKPATLLVAVVLAFLAVLATLAVYWSNLPWAPLRVVAAAAFAVGSLVLIYRRKYVVFLVLWFGILFWWLFLPPSNDRDWRPETAVLATAQFDGDNVTIRNIRNFDYRSVDDFTVGYYDKTFDLTRLRTADLFVSHWDEEETLAHTMVSFGFEGEEYLALSIETRLEKGEKYDALAGLFRQFEIIYVLADERDLVRLRTNYRKETVYLYRSELSPAETRLLLEHILREVNVLAGKPAWYRTIGRNCTTSLVNHMNAVWPDSTPWTRKILMNGYAPEQGHELGLLKSDLPFAEYKRSCRIKAAGKQGFSRAIRAHLR